MQDEEGTPIKQDVKNGKPRFYHQPIPWNYGMLPQATRWPARLPVLCLMLSGATTDGCSVRKAYNVYCPHHANQECPHLCVPAKPKGILRLCAR